MTLITYWTLHEMLRDRSVNLDEQIYRIRDLYRQLSSTTPPDTTRETLQQFDRRYPDAQMWLARYDSHIVGMASTLVHVHGNDIGSSLEDVVVHKAYRGLGLGEALVRKAILLAREERASWIELTSGHQRKAAHRLYEKLGFKKHDTNVYQLDFKP